MYIMKRITSLLLLFVILIMVFASCADHKDEKAPDVVRLGGLKGPTSMGMVKLFDDSDNGKTGNNYEYTIAVSADELTPKLINGELDIVAVPANLGAVLYNNANGAVKTVALCTLGVIYIVEKGGDSVKSISDLKGKTIYATGKGTTPEYALNYLLSVNGLDPQSDVDIVWKSEPTEVVSQMATMDSAVAMMPQPFVTVAQNQLSDLRIALDLTSEWDSLDNGSRFITAVVLVRSQFAEEHPQAVSDFLDDFRASTEFANSSVAETAALVEKYGIVKAAVAEKAIPYCNLVCITGNEMKESLAGYLRILFEQNPKSVGGTLPAESFYMINE